MPKKKEDNGIISQATAEGKKPFDKAKWRREKYGHREKVDKWKNRWDDLSASCPGWFMNIAIAHQS